MFRGPITNSLICLSVAAGATERIKLMSSVVLLPLYQPVLLAKLTSVLDVASGGRYHMGVGVGGEFPDEFAACGPKIAYRSRGVTTEQPGSRSHLNRHKSPIRQYGLQAGKKLRCAARLFMATAGFLTCIRPRWCARA